MNIRRQYSLPNCTLVLEGLSDMSNPLDNTLAIVVNVQCYFVGINQKLEGGRAFLENLVKVVNSYAQECLSGVHHPTEKKEESDRVELVPSKTEGLHHLTWYPAPELNTDPLSLDLTTVQLFDLVEAVDQFIADSQALPDFSVKLQPVSRRYRQPDEPLTQRVVPASLGLVSVAIAALAVYFLPIPEVRKPEPKPQASPTQTVPTGQTPPPSGTSQPPAP
ncbi:MAG: DUF4335 domain-containing protein [Snowella sp.]|nr:DUF4335 domain-containing protein [Snowella sp.]